MSATVAFPSYVENVCICCNIVTFSVTREARGREGGREGGQVVVVKHLLFSFNAAGSVKIN